MTVRFIVATNPQWYVEHAALLGRKWLPVAEYPKIIKPAPREVGALLKPSGEVIHRIKTP